MLLRPLSFDLCGVRSFWHCRFNLVGREADEKHRSFENENATIICINNNYMITVYLSGFTRLIRSLLCTWYSILLSFDDRVLIVFMVTF